MTDPQLPDNARPSAADFDPNLATDDKGTGTI